ncbi:hypothetical protein [Pseudomonas aeruginosa]|uniref:hypothetical protein n=1 Tax=Pseudomonas aeruginosa TaxID=287 RepID=UPI000EAFA725|nr:hypothetical protein [Pseudomonas aeruginosa]
MVFPDPPPRLGKVTGKTISWYEKSGRFSNRFCLYCGAVVGGEADGPSNKEHLIGRSFVPLGSMGSDAFNFLFRACVPCNTRKALAERHLSSTTLLNGPGRQLDPLAAAAAARKAVSDFHPNKPGVAMGDAHEAFSVASKLGSMSLDLGFNAPVQANDNLVRELALRHIQGLFSLLTTRDFREASTLRLLLPMQVQLLGAYPRSDWGNPQLLEVARRAEDWPCHAQIVSASGYFKATMRRHDTRGWFWALEWNKYLRVVGAIAKADMALLDALPDPLWHPLSEGQGRYRLETPLAEEDDTLFSGAVVDSFL